MLILTCQTLYCQCIRHSLGEQTQPGLKMENKKGKEKKIKSSLSETDLTFKSIQDTRNG